MTRKTLREKFKEVKLLERILPDIDDLLGLGAEPPESDFEADEDSALPEPLWEELEEKGEPGL